MSMASIASKTAHQSGSAFSYRRQMLSGIDNGGVIPDVDLQTRLANSTNNDPMSTRMQSDHHDKKFDHQIDTHLLEYSKRINRDAFIVFGCVIFINFSFFLMYCIVIRRVFVFPITEYLYFDLHNDHVSLMLCTINWILFISVISTQILLQEMYISTRAVLRTMIMFFLLNVFGTINSIFIMYPIVTVLNYTYYYRFKARITYFINNIESIDAHSDRNDKYLRLIAINHFLSTLCYKLQAYALAKENKKINNSTIYDKLHQKLNNKKLSILREEPSSAHGYNAENVYQSSIESEINKQRIYHRLTFRLYAIAINVSMVRILFFSDGLDLYNDHVCVYYAFCIKLIIEFVLCAVLLSWCYLDEKLCKIKQNELKTRFYYIVLKSPQFKAVNEIIYDHLLSECDKYYEAWKYTLDGPFTRHVLNQHVGKDVAGCINEHIFGVHKTENIQNLDIDEAFWKDITDTLDGPQS
eukprot:182922_1